MNINLRALFLSMIAGAAIAAPLVVPAPAGASPSDPTAGDSILYTFCSDVQHNEGSNWFDGWNDQQSFDHTNLPTLQGNGYWCGVQRVTSASSYQLTGSAIQTDGYFAGCAISINGVIVDHETATGHYAVAVCG